jgi:hypothetical protein
LCIFQVNFAWGTRLFFGFIRVPGIKKHVRTSAL